MKLATLEAVKNFAEITSSNLDTLIGDLLDYLTEEFSKFCGRDFFVGEKTEFHDGGGFYLFVDSPPIRSIVSIYEDYDYEWGVADLVSPDEYRILDAKIGQIVNKRGRWEEGARAVKVTYIGGYDTLAGQFLSKCLLFDVGTETYIDHTVEAQSQEGTPFEAIGEVGDYLYFLKSTQFQELLFNIVVAGSYGANDLLWEYWNGASWAALTVSGAGINLGADGSVLFTKPADWAMSLVDGNVGYAVRVSASEVVTPATIYQVKAFDYGYGPVVPKDLEKAAIVQCAYEVKRRKDIGLTSVAFSEGVIEKRETGQFLKQVEEILAGYRLRMVS